MSNITKSLLALLACALSVASLWADTIKLEGGRTIRGQIVDEKSTDRAVVVRLLVGKAEVTIERSQIQEIIIEKSPIEQYEEFKGKYGDTADDQWKLAMWCEEHKLSKQRKEHLEAVLKLDPDHAEAREKLGFVRYEGKWMTANEIKEARGLVRYGRRYVTPQEKEILEQKRRQDEEEKGWHAKVKMWKGWVLGNDPSKARQGEERLRAIDDPNALEAVVGHLGKENTEQLRILMCDILQNLPGEQATLELVKRSIIDASHSVRWAAIDKLVERDDPQTVRTLMGILKSEHNVVIRRTAEALGALGDATAVPALIDVLVTKHKQVVTRPGPSSFLGTQSPAIVDYEPVVAPGVVAFRPVIGYQAQGAGFAGTSQEVVNVPVENDEVHNALVQLTDEDFGFNQAAWRQWLTSQKKKDDEAKNRKPRD